MYVTIGFYVLAENMSGKHVKTRDVSDAVRTALETAAWPLVLLPWRELLSWLREQASALEPRYRAMP